MTKTPQKELTATETWDLAWARYYKVRNLTYAIIVIAYAALITLSVTCQC